MSTLPAIEAALECKALWTDPNADPIMRVPVARNATGETRETTDVEATLQAIHVLAAAIWVGGTVGLVFVAVPPVQRLEGEARARLLREFGRRWRPIGWSALGIATVTGLGLAGYDHAFDTAPASFDWVLGVKGALVGLLACGAYVHDYVLGPGLARQIRAGEPQSLRPLLTAMGRANLAITVALPVLGVVLSELVS
jgi:putative copper export protein